MDQRTLALAEKANRIKTHADRWIWVTFQKAGFHKYPAAATDPNLQDVSYLGTRHRHLFKFKVQIEIYHNDRELEFHQVLNYCESLYQQNQLEIDYKSVEMLADDLYDQLAIKYPGRNIKIEVSEDGECGCVIEYTKAKPQVLTV
jgi:hypothetical protein